MNVVFSHGVLILYEISGPKSLGLEPIGVCSFESLEFAGEDRQEHSFDLRFVSLEIEILHGLSDGEAEAGFGDEMFHDIPH